MGGSPWVVRVGHDWVAKPSPLFWLSKLKRRFVCYASSGRKVCSVGCVRTIETAL